MGKNMTKNEKKKPVDEAQQDKTVPPLDEKNCANCVHFFANPQNIRHGACRRYPPTVIATPATDQEGNIMVTKQGQIVNQPTVHFPGVHAQAMCGEHKERGTRH